MSSLGEQLSLFTSSDDELSTPFIEQEEEVIIPEETETDDDKSISKLASIITQSHPKTKKKKNKEKKSNNSNTDISFRPKLLSDDDLSDDFDFLFDALGEDDEDNDLKNTLTSMGRKYARQTELIGETSEVSKMFSGNEKRLNQLLAEIRRDKDALNKELTQMTSMRTRNFKALADLRDVNNQYHNTELATIKELNSMKKTQYELSLKAKAVEKGDAETSSVNGNLISDLFSLGRKNIMGQDGYRSVSGASSAGNGNGSSMPDVINPDYAYMGTDDEDDGDGDKFLKYENVGAHYVLLVSASGLPQGILAEDKDGNLLEDYPMPTEDVSALNFELDWKLGVATDAYHREYQIRQV